jgi:acyl-CoA synthetase (AMP-forming)/AMP-acid ligase II
VGSAAVAIDIDEERRRVNIAWWLERASDLYGERTALLDGRRGERWTYRELRSRADAVGQALRTEYGIGPDDVVATLMPDDCWHTAIFYGVLRIGAVFSGFNRTLGVAKFADDIARLDAGTLIVGEAQLELGRQLLAQTRLERLLVCAAPGEYGVPNLRELATGRDSATQVTPRVQDDLAAINFTGGTSGVSKGVMFPHGRLALSAQASLLFDKLRETDVNLSCISLYHSGGIHDAVKWVLAGAAVVLTGGWDADLAARLITEHRPTWIYFWVPTMVRDLMRHPSWDELPLSGVRSIVSGESVPVELQAALIERGVVAQNSYGMTESMPVGILKPLVAHGETPPLGSSGRPLPELCETALFDPDTGDRITEPGVTGEVCVRGDVISPGYYNDTDRTEAAFDADGWLHTRDVASFDAQGWWFLAGRTDDIINSGAEKLSLLEVEDVLRRHSAVRDVACVPVEHDRFGQVPSAIVVLTSELSDTEAATELDAHCLAHLERWKRPRLYRVVTEVPRTMPKRTKDLRALRELVAGTRLRDADGVLGWSQLP